jgi:hypothetical protein
MSKYSVKDTDNPKLKVLIEEITYLEWINRALKQQIQINENRLAEIDKEIVKEQKI